MLAPMKHASLAIVSSLGVLVLAGAPVACFSSSAAPGDDSGPGVDSAAPGDDTGAPAVDAAPPPGDSGTKDSGPADAGADTTVVDAGPQPLTLTVLKLGSPEPGVNVVFQDDTGAVVATATTDVAGTVSQLVVPGSQVTALLGDARSPSPVTIQGVAPGDVLTVVDVAPGTTPPPGENVTVTLPAGTWDAAGADEEVYAGQCYNPVSYPLYLASYCETAGEFPLLARAVDTTSQEEIAYTYQLGNAAQPDGGLPDGATSLPITVALPWETSTAVATITAANPPGLPGEGGTTGTANDVAVTYYEEAEGLSFSVPASPGGAIDDAGTQTASFVMHPGYPSFVQAGAVDTIPSDGAYVVAAGATRAAAQATSLAASLDLSTIPLITGTSVDTADGGATAQPSVNWTSTGSLAGASGIYVSAQWSDSFTTDAGTTYVSGTWTILAPPTATTVHAPSLPASLAAWAPSPTASFYTTPRVAAVQASFIPDYATFRATFGGLPLLSGYTLTLPTLPVNGTAYLVGFYPDEG